MELVDVMRTTFACREFTDQPVTDEQLHRIFDVARFAPTGGNRQGVRTIVIREDAELRAALEPLLLRTFAWYAAQTKAGEAPFNTINPSSLDRASTLDDTEDHLGVRGLLAAPVLLVFVLDLSVTASMDADLDRVGVISGASVYPFVWNVLLAARNEGLGGTLTTGVADHEAEVKALLNIPDNFAVAALVPIGHPVKQLTKLTRRPVEDLVVRGRFGGEPFTL